MEKAINPSKLSAAIQEELTLYSKRVTERVNECSAEAVENLVQKTKATAPKRAGKFRRSIASKMLEKGVGGETYAWYVKPPNHRLTHLLVHGHAKQNGGRVKGDPFLSNALDEVLPTYEKAVEEAVKNG